MVAAYLTLEQKELIIKEFGTDAAEYTELVEAIIVIANDQYLLKAEQSPYMMKDRPLVAFQYDSMPNRFWGRGIAEKGYNCQKAIDAQKWGLCQTEPIPLDPEKETWFGLDLKWRLLLVQKTQHLILE